jgi:two-component system, NarL family, sensor histidine kinase DevS
VTREASAPSSAEEAVPSHAGPKQLRALLAAVMSVASDLDLATVLDRVVKAARDLVGARYAALGVLDPTHTYLAEFITVGLDDDERARIGELPKGHGVLGFLIVDPRSVRLPDLTQHADSFGFPPNHPPMKSFLGVPLYIRGEVFGNICLTDKEGEEGFSDIDEELALRLAAAVGLAIDNARVHQQTAELSVLDDRNRIGRELADHVIQRLFAIGLAMHATMQLTSSDAEVRTRLEQHVDELDESISEIRMAVFKLETASSSRPGLRREVLDIVAESSRLLGFEPTVGLVGPIDALVLPKAAVHFLAVLREALSNVARHAMASHVEVTVQADKDLMLEVVDDGRGLMRGPDRATNGLMNMIRRAEELGGSAYITPGRDRGTRVQWMIPLPK